MKGHITSRVLVGFPVALLLVQQLYWGGERFVAQMSAFGGLATMDWWSEWDINPDEAQWQPVHEQLQGALSHTPRDPALLAELGDLYTVRRSDDTLTDTQDAEAVVLGSFAYLSALQQRPTWVRDWDDLALLKYNQQQYADADFQFALRQMARYGYRRSGMMELLADMSTKAWPELDEETRSMVAAVTDIEQRLSQQRVSTLVN
jgi:hypothetical protein